MLNEKQTKAINVLRRYSRDELLNNSLLKTLKDVTGTDGTWRDVLEALADLIEGDEDQKRVASMS